MDLPVKRVEQLNCGGCGASIDPASVAPLAETECPKCGKELVVPARFDTYLLLKVIGTGGTGVVIRALDDTLYRQVAIKILKGKGDDDETTLAITREARALASVNDPGIVSIHTLGKWKDRHYIVMELLDGGTARVYLEPEHRPTEAEVITLGIRVARGLDAALSVGLLHLDVKPSNILLSRTGEPKVIDFGAAQYARKRKGGAVVGTPYYIAPELLKGKTPNARSDQYSLGGTLFHLLAGVPEFESTSINQTITHRLTVPARRVRDADPMISEATDAVIARMMAQNPDDRYASYEAVADDLEDALDIVEARDEFGPTR